MKFAYEMFQAAYQAQDSPIIACFRELWERLAEGLEPTPVDLEQVDHMAGWLQGKVEQYAELPLQLEALHSVFESARQGWELLLEGVYCLAAFLEEGNLDVLEESRALAEDGEQMLQWLEEAIVANRDESPLCDGFMS